MMGLLRCKNYSVVLMLQRCYRGLVPSEGAHLTAEIRLIIQELGTGVGM